MGVGGTAGLPQRRGGEAMPDVDCVAGPAGSDDDAPRRPCNPPPWASIAFCSVALCVTVVAGVRAGEAARQSAAASESDLAVMLAPPPPPTWPSSQEATPPFRLPSGVRRPLAFTQSGGGHRAMTTAMGLARALRNVRGPDGEEDGWRYVTHLSSISGGAWFASQFVHSSKFYEAVVGRVGRPIDEQRPIDEVVSEWGELFADAIAQGIESGRIDTSLGLNSSFTYRTCDADALTSAQSIERECSDLVEYVKVVIQRYSVAAQYPVVDWAAYTGEQLAPYIPLPRTFAATADARAQTRRGGLQTATLIEGAALLYDTWVPAANGSASAPVRATAHVHMHDERLTAKLLTHNWPFPVAHVLAHDDASATGWYVSPEVANITVSTAGDGGTTQTRPLVLGDVPAGDIAASSSAAFAMVASPSALEKLVKWSIEKSGVSAAAELTLKQLFNTYFDTSLGQSQVDRCLPAQLHNLAISVPLAAAGGGGGGGGGSGGGGGGSLPDTYRLADGVFGENNGVAFALARMQADCLAPSAPVHCPEGNRTVLELIAVDHAPRKALQKPQPHDLNALFSDYPFPNRGGVVPDWTTVDAAVFRDAFPLEEAWEVYEPAQQSKYWRGELTTAHNPYYGVGGGWRVRTLILRPNLELGGVLRGDTLGSLGGGTQVYYGGHMAKLFFQRVYAPTAKRQAECAQPVLEAFLGNASLPASGCVPPSAQTATPPSTTAPPAPPAPQRGPETYYEGTMGAYATALLSVSGCYILLSLLATAAFGWLAGRARWTSGPWCTGYIGAGDGSLQPGLIESVMILAGFPSAAPDLYYYDQASEDLDNRRPMGAKIAIPTSLSRRGFRGRSDDPGHRKGPLSRPHFLLRLREESPAGGLATLRWGVAQLLGWTEEVAPAHAHVATRADSTRVRWHHDAPSEPTAPPQSQRSAAVQNGAASEPAKPATSSTSQLSTLPPSAPPPSAPPPSAPPPSAPPLSAPAVAFEDDAERAKREAAAHLLGGSVAHPASHELVKLVGLLSQDNVQHAHQHGGGLPQELRASIDRLQLLLVPQAHQLHESSERYREAAVRAYEQRRQAWERVQRVLCCAGAWAAPGPSVNDSHHDHTSHMWRTTMLAAHYGKQKFRSDSLAVFIVLGSLTHVMAKAFNQGSYLGPSRLYGDRWIFTKIVHESFLSPVELHLASALQPLVWDGATAGYLRFATLLETFLIAVPTVVHVVLLSVGNVEGSHRGWVVVSLAYTLLLVADGFLYRYVCLDQLERLFTGDAASSQPPSPLCAPDKYYVSYYGGQGDNLIVKNFIAPFEAFSFYATLIILILYVVRTTHLHAETVAQTDGRPSATRAELLKSLSNVARGVERRLAEWFFNALRLLIGASKQQVTEIKFPVMLAAATVTEIAVSCAVVVLGAFLQEKIQEIKTSALDVMDVVVGATSRSLAFDQLVSSIGGVAVGVETCTVGDEQLDPGAASTLNDLVSTVIYTWLPILREAIPVLVEHCIVGGVVGCCLSFLLTLKGIRKTWATFYELYGLLYTHQHTCMRTPLRKANSVRLMSTLIFYQLFGFTLVVAFCSFMGLLIGLASVEWPGKLWLRALFANALIAQLTEMAYVRTCVTPLFQLFECGPALFVINLWYMSLGLIKGITRISLLLCLVILSNFSPHQCMFPDGMEAWDSAHVCFTCYVMERVVQDHHDRHLIGKSKGLMKGVLQFQHAGHAMDRAKVSPDPDEAGAKPKAPPDPDATTDGADMVHKFAEPSAAEPSTERSAEPSLPMARIHLPPPDLSASPRC